MGDTQTRRILRYAGIGPRATPPDQLRVMGDLAGILAAAGWHLSSGWGAGADQAFGRHTPIESQTQWLPWAEFNGADTKPPFVVVAYSRQMGRIAAEHHPYWGNMRSLTRDLMTRNVAILLGQNLDQQVDMVVYWQSEKDEKSLTSGTNHTRRIADSWGIPTFNIRLEAEQTALIEFVARMEETVQV